MSMESLKKNLEEKGYQVSCFETKEEAAQYLVDNMQDQKIAFGGSITLEQMGLFEKLSVNNEVIWHWKVPEGKTGADILKEAKNADIYFSSVNGISEDGQIVNIDGNGNRVAATLFGHKKVYLVAGINKIAPDLDGALHRARNIAAPMNAKRLNKQTPCAVNGDKCYNCKSSQRICRGLTVLWEKPAGCAYEMILVNENLGY